MTLRLLLAAALLALAVGCASKPEPAQLSGKVTFKGRPVPAGWISFTPDVEAGGLGQVRVFQIKDGVYDSSQEDPPGIPPGPYLIKIAGFDGKKIPYFGQGKQIFNPVDDKYTVPPGTSTKDFVIPESAGYNVKIQPTADS
ncbi:MAG TPA: hypothetical protein VNK04_05720 [Gemmataceae bacterium]|jgi:hypothetical protein|nr:hypothetical protein [Gemmataceae bacterium]